LRVGECRSSRKRADGILPDSVERVAGAKADFYCRIDSDDRTRENQPTGIGEAIQVGHRAAMSADAAAQGPYQRKILCICQEAGIANELSVETFLETPPDETEKIEKEHADSGFGTG